MSIEHGEVTIVKVGTRPLMRPDDVLGMVGGWAMSTAGRSVIVSSGARYAGKRYFPDSPDRYYSGWNGVIFPSWSGAVRPANATSHLVSTESFDVTVNDIRESLDQGNVPIINEHENSGFGNNDRLSAELALALPAGRLIMAGEESGVFEDPTNPNTRVSRLDISEVSDRPELIGPSSEYGTGGMEAKLAAAELAVRHGVDTVVGYWGHLPKLVASSPGFGTRFTMDGNLQL